jgi:hypothetical protein
METGIGKSDTHNMKTDLLGPEGRHVGHGATALRLAPSDPKVFDGRNNDFARSTTPTEVGT